LLPAREAHGIAAGPRGCAACERGRAARRGDGRRQERGYSSVTLSECDPLLAQQAVAQHDGRAQGAQLGDRCGEALFEEFDCLGSNAGVLGVPGRPVALFQGNVPFSERRCPRI
jgi:hypothetical protein